jgi:hypothetical protein
MVFIYRKRYASGRYQLTQCCRSNTYFSHHRKTLRVVHPSDKTARLRGRKSLIRHAQGINPTVEGGESVSKPVFVPYAPALSKCPENILSLAEERERNPNMPPNTKA